MGREWRGRAQKIAGLRKKKIKPLLLPTRPMALPACSSAADLKLTTGEYSECEKYSTAVTALVSAVQKAGHATINNRVCEIVCSSTATSNGIKNSTGDSGQLLWPNGADVNGPLGCTCDKYNELYNKADPDIDTHGTTIGTAGLIRKQYAIQGNAKAAVAKLFLDRETLDSDSDVTAWRKARKSYLDALRKAIQQHLSDQVCLSHSPCAPDVKCNKPSECGGPRAIAKTRNIALIVGVSFGVLFLLGWIVIGAYVVFDQYKSNSDSSRESLFSRGQAKEILNRDIRIANGYQTGRTDQTGRTERAIDAVEKVAQGGRSARLAIQGAAGRAGHQVRGAGRKIRAHIKERSAAARERKESSARRKRKSAYIGQVSTGAAPGVPGLYLASRADEYRPSTPDHTEYNEYNSPSSSIGGSDTSNPFRDTSNTFPEADRTLVTPSDRIRTNAGSNPLTRGL